MAKKKNLFISLAALGLVAAAAIAGSLGLAGAFDSDNTSPTSVQRPSPSPTPNQMAEQPRAQLPAVSEIPGARHPRLPLPPRW